MLFEFLWGSGKEKFKRRTTFKDMDDGQVDFKVIRGKKKTQVFVITLQMICLNHWGSTFCSRTWL